MARVHAPWMTPLLAAMSVRSTSAPATDTPPAAKGARCTRSRDPSSESNVAPGRSAVAGT
jgi:hypothetical protein